MITYKRCSYFTMLEMLVVMFILSLGVIVTGVKVQQSYFEQRFFSETQQVLGQLVMAQDLMLILDTDVTATLRINPENHFLNVSLQVEKPLPDAWTRLVEKEMEFPSIHSFEFQSEDFREQNPLILNFSFGQMSQGKLTLSEGKKVDVNGDKIRQFTIELPGYPSPLGKAAKEENQGRQREESNQFYPVEVYEKLYKSKEKDIKTPAETPIQSPAK